MRKHLVGVSLLAVAFSARSMQAQGPISIIEAGVFGTFTKIDDKIRMDNVPGVGGMLSVSAYRWLGFEVNGNIGSTSSTRPPNEDITYSPYRLMATLSLPIQKAALIVGGGYVNSVYKGRATPNEYEDGMSGMIGLKLCGSGRLGFRGDVIGDFNPSPNEQELTGTSLNITGRLGLTWALRGNCHAKPGVPFDWSMAIAPATATIANGSSRQFALSAVDNGQKPIETRRVNNLTCSSSDASVATVDNTGNVRALKPGTATITCRGMVKNIERSTSATVTVPYPDWNFTLAPPSQTRDVGQTASYTTTARDVNNTDLGAATSWSSSNNGVATVNNGTVTCVSGGTATITATKNANGGTKTATATITCNAPPPPPPSRGMIRVDSTHFDFDRATLKPAGRSVLQEVVDAMKRDANLRVSVEGHTDWYGDESYNDNLSTRRATTVMNTLKRLAGRDVAADRFSMKGYGEQCILVRDGDPDPNPPRPRVSQENRNKQEPNRRVEVWQLLSGESGSPASCRSESDRAGRVPFSSMR